MIPFKTIIKIDRSIKVPIYLQISQQLIVLMKNGALPPNTKLPGTRTLSEHLNVHRKSVITCYDELMSQAWIDVIPSKGAFVSSSLPITQIQPQRKKKNKEVSGFSFAKRSHLNYEESISNNDFISINDGLPDTRLSPIEEIASTYRNIIKRKQHRNLGYDSIYGNLELRKELIVYLNETRGLSVDLEQILITRGSQMGIYLASQLIVSTGGDIIVGKTNYKSANDTFMEMSANLNKVDMDENGLNTHQIEKICKQKQIDAVYVTSHHHHPTTVALSPERRMHLLTLANIYKFAIIEDDYAYDFHYSNAPIMPLASNDLYGNVVYIGSLSKTIAPAIRIGYLVAPKDFVKEAAQYRKIIDRQGDPLLELTMAFMIKDRSLQRYSKKALKIYKNRRDLFCKLLKEKLSDYISFEVPDGGMAVWVQLDKKYSWDNIKDKAYKKGLLLNDWQRYDTSNQNHNCIRMGFASLNEEEIIKAITILETLFSEV